MFNTVFNVASWGPWVWVVLAWAQLLVTYGGYQFYLNRRLKRLEERTSNV